MTRLLLVFFGILVAAVAGSIPGSYTCNGDPISGPPFQLSSTGCNDLTLTLSTVVLFHDFTEVSALFVDTAGGSSSGSPSLQLSFANGDYIAVRLGDWDSGNFVDSVAGLNAWSGVNLLNNDPGRYDLSGVSGFSTDSSTNYANALAVVGNETVVEADLILGQPGQALTATAINLETPEPQATLLFLAGIVVLLMRASCLRQPHDP